MTVASISLSLGGNVFLVVTGLLFLVGSAILFYRYTLPPLPRSLRVILSSIRSIALILLLLILFEPVLRLANQHEQHPVVAVLVDDSQSMTIKDARGERSEELRKFLNAQPFDHLSSGAQVSFYPFSSKLDKPIPKPADSASFKGEETNISEALAETKSLFQHENIQAAVLLSDGNYTTGKNPVYDAQDLGIPVFTVGIGDTNEQKDLLVERVATNSLAYAETKIPVSVTIKSSGYNGEQVEVLLSEGQTVLDRAKISLQPGVREYPVIMHVEPKEEGVKKYTVSISTLPGELTVKNNSRQVFIKVLKSKLRIVLLAGAPQPDVAAVRQALVDDGHFAVQSYVQKSENQFYEGTPSRSSLDSADCFVLIGFPSPATSTSFIGALGDVISQQHKGVFFINGKQVDTGKLQALQSNLPFTFSPAGTGELLISCGVAERANHHPLIELEGKFSADTWRQLPPIYKMQTTFHAKPESEVLAWASVQGISLNEPLALLRNINRQKTFAVTGYGIWRWQLLTQGTEQAEPFLKLFVSNVVRWLTTKEDEKNVRISPTKEMYTSAEPVEFTGQVYDDQLRPVDDAEVRVQLQHGKENIELAMHGIGNGMYEGSLDGVGEGDYSFSGKAVREGRTLGEDKGKISVGQMNVEFNETKMNKQTLEQIAYRTNGKYYDVEHAGDIAADLASAVHFTPRQIVEASEIELWNWKYLSGFVIVLLAIEWFLRKKNGML